MGKFTFNAVLLVVLLLFVVSFSTYPIYSSPPGKNVSPIDAFKGVDVLKKINISSCAILDTPGTYVLTEDIVPSLDNRKCINIQSDDVIFDCQGHSITNEEYGGGNSYAVYSDKNKFTIRNCYINIQGGGIGGAGIMMENVKDFLIEDNSIIGNTYGVYGYATSNGVIKNNEFDDNFWNSILFTNSRNNLIEKNQVKNNGITNGGITISTSDNNKINNNIFTESQLSLVFESSNNVLDGNKIYNSKSSGIYLHVDSNNNVIKNTLVDGAFISGLLVDDSGDNIFRNILVKNSGYGFYMSSSSFDYSRSDNNILYNVISQNNFNYDFYFKGKFDNTTFIDGSFGDYWLSDNTFNVVKRGFGSVEFLEKVDGQGNFDKDIILNHNFVNLDISRNPGLNKSALISLFNMQGNFTNPVIYKDGFICTECEALSSLNSKNVLFKIFSTGKYWIGEL